MTTTQVETQSTIRCAAPVEAPILSDLAFRSKAHWGYDEAFMEACRADLTMSPDDILDGMVYVLGEARRIVGYYKLRLHGAEAELADLFVEPQAIGKGYGKRLWRHAVDTARQAGAQWMTFQSDPHAEGFYRAMGAERVGASQSTVFPGRMLPLMRFSLELKGERDMRVEPVVLEGTWVRLEPLAERHAADLALVSGDDEIWRYMPADLRERAAIDAWIAEALALRASGAILPFAIVELASGRAIGGTRYLSIMPKDRGIEIGWTWLARAAWRTPVNSECKYLLLRHAFETLGCIRVQLKTDRRNERSRRAIERIGGQFEGILRNHMIMPYGLRDSAFYSIIDAEWPGVKANMAGKLYRDT